VTIFSFGSLMTQKEAQAQQVEFELLGKFGAGNSYLDVSSLGVPEFNVLGGLQMSVLCRFDLGLAIGLNFNWTMLHQRIGETQLNYALEWRNREMTIQHPSFGVAFRYMIYDLFDIGLWLNYGFGSNEIEYKKGSQNDMVASAYGMMANNRRANLDWDLQSFEIGLAGIFSWRIPAVPELNVLVGLQLFLDASRMLAADSTLTEARDIHGNNLDENTLTTIGFMLVFGARYDLKFGD
jgi:hypothetical protein